MSAIVVDVAVEVEAEDESPLGPIDSTFALLSLLELQEANAARDATMRIFFIIVDLF